MTQRYYYDDAYQTSFEASVVEWVEHEGKPAVVLDGTHFYPTSGGQPHDTGTIGSSRVVDVLVRPRDGEILHVLDIPLEDDKIHGEIDWRRRFDHMQQHTGQHILSQAFVRFLSAETASFHLGASSSTIDIRVPELAIENAAAVEDLANQIVWDNRTVDRQIVPREEASQFPMRKAPPSGMHRLRLVEIDDFDVSACGGTHVKSTGEIGQVKVIGWVRHKGMVRVEFVCGQRALYDYRAKNQVVRDLSALLTTSYQDIEKSVTSLLNASAENRKQLRSCRKALIDYKADALLNGAYFREDQIVVVKVLPDADAIELREIANALCRRKPLVSLLASIGERTTIIFAKSIDSDLNMGVLIKKAFAMLGSGSGGGSATYAQGSSEVTNAAQVDDILTGLAREELI